MLNYGKLRRNTYIFILTERFYDTITTQHNFKGVNILKNIKLIFILFISIMLVACSNNSKDENNISSKTDELPDLPKKSFF